MTFRYLYRVLLILLTVPFISPACVDKGTLPTYFYLAGAPPPDGAPPGEQRIEDYWIYLENKLLGVYHPGNYVPILGEGSRELAIYPGIRSNGMRDEAVIYPFLEDYRTTVDLCACNGRDSIFPRFRYKPATRFSFSSGFESENIFLIDYDPDEQTTLQVQSDSVFMGENTARLTVTREHPHNFVGTSTFYSDFDPNSREVFLELNYKSSAYLQVALDFRNSLIYTGPQALVNLYPSAEWKKLYISLAGLTNNANTNEGCRILLNAVYDLAGPLNTQNVFVDNIKLVHF